MFGLKDEFMEQNNKQQEERLKYNIYDMLLPIGFEIAYSGLGDQNHEARSKIFHSGPHIYLQYIYIKPDAIKRYFMNNDAMKVDHDAIYKLYSDTYEKMCEVDYCTDSLWGLIRADLLFQWVIFNNTYLIPDIVIQLSIFILNSIVGGSRSEVNGPDELHTRNKKLQALDVEYRALQQIREQLYDCRYIYDTQNERMNIINAKMSKEDKDKSYHPKMNLKQSENTDE